MCDKLFVAVDQSISLNKGAAVKKHSDDMIGKISVVLLTRHRIPPERKQVALPARVKPKCNTNSTEVFICDMPLAGQIP